MQTGPAFCYRQGHRPSLSLAFGERKPPLDFASGNQERSRLKSFIPFWGLLREADLFLRSRKASERLGSRLPQAKERFDWSSPDGVEIRSQPCSGRTPISDASSACGQSAATDDGSTTAHRARARRAARTASCIRQSRRHARQESGQLRGLRTRPRPAAMRGFAVARRPKIGCVVWMNRSN